MKNMTKKQKQLFIDHADLGFENLNARDFEGTIAEALINQWEHANMQLEDLFDDLQQEVGE